MIKAPYNFVPLSDKVFFPPWAEQVSHDIPFSDGESGEIDVTITAKSPIFIRNHEVDESNPRFYYTDKNDNRISTEFCNHVVSKNGIKEKKYYIPGTSFKGMTRNVLEIMSFSKIPIDKKKFKNITGTRDMTQDKSTGDIFEHDMVAMSKKCGLVNLSLGEFIDYGNVLKIKNNQITSAFPNSNYNYRSKSIYEKYNSISSSNTITVGESYTANGQKYYNYLQSGENARLFMNEHFGEGFKEKKHEFILMESSRANNSIVLKPKIIQNFKDVYFRESYKDKASDKWNVGEYWEYRYAQNNDTWIPVFYAEDDSNIVALGLTQVFKLPYKKTFIQASNNRGNKLDLAETIFGTVNEDADYILKGRVQFSHFEASVISYDAEKEPEEEVLSEPKPTYYPNYIRQTELNDDGTVALYKTLMDNDVKISGWKRYPLRQSIKDDYSLPTNDDGTVKYDIVTKFKPLDTTTTFKGKIRFHNLKKSEIGALVSALTFHGNEDTNYHSIGMAKPLGYGKIEVKLTKIKTQKNSDNIIEEREKETYIKEFESYMSAFYEHWLSSEQIRELIAMTRSDIRNDNNLVYQSLGKDNKNNDFTEDKKSRNYLGLYSYSLDGKTQILSPYSESDDIDKAKKYMVDTEKWVDLQNEITLEKVRKFVNSNLDNRYIEQAKNMLVVLEKEEEVTLANKDLKTAMNTPEQWRENKLKEFINGHNENTIFSDLVKKANIELSKYAKAKPKYQQDNISLSSISREDELWKYLVQNKKDLDTQGEELKATILGMFEKLDSQKKKKTFIKKLNKNVHRNFSKNVGLV